MKIEGKQLVSRILMVVMLISLCILTAYGYVKNTNRGTELHHTQLYDWNDGWQFQGGHTVSFPFQTQWIKHQQILFENTLPADVEDGWAISYASNYAAHKIYVGDKLVYSYGEQKAIPFGNMTGNIRIVAPICKEDAGKTLRIVITPYYSADFEMHGVNLGNRDGILIHILEANIWRVIAIPLLMLLALLTLCLGIYHNFTSLDKNNSAMFYFTLFEGSMAWWLLASCDIPQFFTEANVFVSICSFFSLAVVPIAFNGFCKSLFQKDEKPFEIMLWFGYGNIFLQMLLFVTDISDPMGTLWMTHAELIFTILVTFIVAIKNLKRDKNARVVFVLLVGFLIFCIGALVAFYRSPGNRDDGVWIAWGLIVFSIGVLFLLESRELAGSREVLKSTLYRKMAYTDNLTELGNRMALERDLDHIMDNVPDGKRVMYVMCDLNRLKYTNDTYGHEAGDEMIKNAALCIKRAIPEDAHCYRLGGDEFGILLADSEITAWYLIDKVEEEMAKYNEDHLIKLSMAMGSATDLLNKNQTGFFKELFKKADDQMYEVKRQQHMAREQARPQS